MNVASKRGAAFALALAFAGSAAPAVRAAGDEPAPERTYSVHLFDGTPLAVTDVRNLDAENWPRALEIEVKNTGTKPIYFANVVVVFVGAEGANGKSLAAPVWFGDRHLGATSARPTATDPAIAPGESRVLRLNEAAVASIDARKADVRDLYLSNSAISFGDGTGFTGGAAFPMTGPCPVMTGAPAR